MTEEQIQKGLELIEARIKVIEEVISEPICPPTCESHKKLSWELNGLKFSLAVMKGEPHDQATKI